MLPREFVRFSALRGWLGTPALSPDTPDTAVMLEASSSRIGSTGVTMTGTRSALSATLGADPFPSRCRASSFFSGRLPEDAGTCFFTPGEGIPELTPGPRDGATSVLAACKELSRVD